MFAFLAEHRTRLFPPAMFEDLFPTRLGRPSLPPEVVACVIVLQTLHGFSDREAVEALTFDLRWKAACGYAIDAAGFHPSALTYWRRRLGDSDRPERIFDAVRDVITATGVLRGKTRRALDSTILDDAVARQDTVTQLIAAIRRVGREVPDAAGLITDVCTRLGEVCGPDWAGPGGGYTLTAKSAGKPPIAWDDQDARDLLVSALVEDALALLGALDEDPGLEAISAAGGKPAEAIALLALVAGQDVEPAEDSDGTDGRWRIARKTAPDRVISTVDVETRHAHKTQHRRQDGFKAHVVVEPDTGLITATALTKASGPANSDAAVGITLIGADTTISSCEGERVKPLEDSEPVVGQPLGLAQVGVEVLADSAYATGPMLQTLTAGGMREVMKPWPHKPAVEGGFSIDDFVPDHAAGTGVSTLTCPAGVTRVISPSGTATFGIACRGCPLRARCTTAASGRSVNVHPQDELMRTHRARFADPDYQATYRRHRPMVERSIAWLTRANRRVRFRGVIKNNQWLHHRVAALNLRRMLALGLTVRDGGWAIV